MNSQHEENNENWDLEHKKTLHYIERLRASSLDKRSLYQLQYDSQHEPKDHVKSDEDDDVRFYAERRQTMPIPEYFDVEDYAEFYIGDEEETEFIRLQDLLHNGIISSRLHAAESLGELGGERAARELCMALIGAEEELQETICEALYLTGDLAIAPLTELLHTSDLSVRSLAADVLGSIQTDHSTRSKDTIKSLRHTILYDDKRRASAVEAISNLRGSSALTKEIPSIAREVLKAASLNLTKKIEILEFLGSVKCRIWSDGIEQIVRPLPSIIEFCEKLRRSKDTVLKRNALEVLDHYHRIVVKSAEVRKPFALSMENVQQKIAETTQVAQLLRDIFQEEEASLIQAVPVITPACELSTFKNLDNQHFVFVKMLARKRLWTKQEAEQIATPLGLMAGGAIEHLNEIALEARDECVIEGDDPIEVNIELIEELLA